MPKIRHAAAMFLLGAFCIAFNTARYPAVRGMVAIPASPAPAQSRSPEKVTDIANTRDNFYPSEPPERKSPGGVASKDGARTRIFSKSPLASLNATHFDDEASVASRQADNERTEPVLPRREESFMGTPPEDPPAIRSELVPIRRPTRRDQAERAGRAEEESAVDALPQVKRDPGTTGFRRLPPVDGSGDPDALPLASDFAQTYPVTTPAN